MDIPKKHLADGNEIPLLGLGTWQMEKEACLKAVPLALELGYRHIDTAFAYYNEQYIGEAIQGFAREKLFLTTKLWRDFHHPAKVEEGCDASLKSLGTSYLDLYLIHWPEKRNMVEILGAMHRLKEKGKVKSIGVCNATIFHLKELERQKISVVVNQVEFHPYLNQDELLAFCREKKIALTAYSPIVQGKIQKEPLLQKIGQKYRKSAAQVCLCWLIQKGIIAIPKGSSKPHLKENLEVFDFKLSQEEMQEIEKLHEGRRLVKPDFHEFDS